MKKRVTDFIADFLIENGLNNVYMVTGGAAMHLNDSFGNDKRFNVHHLHHEQSCSIAAESHARHNYMTMYSKYYGRSWSDQFS